MISLRPIALILMIAVGSHAIAGEPGPDLPPDRPAAVAEPTAKVVSTSRKKGRGERSATPVLETFPPTDDLQAGQPAVAPGIERVVYDRSPLRVALSAGQERRVYLPWEAALHLPPDAAGLNAQVIGSTLYLTGQSGQPTVRVIAEGLDGQGMIPLDVQVRDQAGVPGEMEISMATRNERRAPARRATMSDDDEDEPEEPDLVQLTRHCSQQLYAPQRLVKPLPGVRAVDIRSKPVAGLYRTSAVLTTPIGAWRSAGLYVTAVRFTNRGQSELELDMDLLRGRWVAATPQHHILAPAGSEADTTAVCLISEQPFDAARP